MPAAKLRALVVAMVVVGFAATGARPIAYTERPGTAIDYRIERLAETGRDLSARFTASQLAMLEKLNRADIRSLPRLKYLVVPSAWHDDDLRYSPFPLWYPAGAAFAKLLVVDQPAQAFAGYEQGQLVRWGPVSSGQQASPTPSGLFYLNWRSQGRYSTVNPEWYMEWYFNFDNSGGRALHSYRLPGYPASHSCIRLLERDAMWLYEWGEPGTPLLILAQYAFGAPAPWRSLEYVARGIDLPDSPVWDVPAY